MKTIKKMLPAIALILCSSTLFAQKYTKDFVNTQKEKLSDAFFKSKPETVQKALDDFENLAKELEKLPKDKQNELQEEIANLYFSIACYMAPKGDKNKAMDYLIKADRLGVKHPVPYSRYGNFDNLRRIPAFTKLDRKFTPQPSDAPKGFVRKELPRYEVNGRIQSVKNYTNKEVEDFIDDCHFTNDYNGKNFFQNAIEKLQRFVKELESLPIDTQNDLKKEIAQVYYYIAANYSFLGEKKPALDYLEKAVQSGLEITYHFMFDNAFVNISETKRFQKIASDFTPVKQKSFLEILQESSDYCVENSNMGMSFVYDDPSHPELIKLRRAFNLDSIAGQGDEVSKIKKIMLWVHDTFRHDGSFNYTGARNAMDIAAFCSDPTQKRGVNCRMMATLLNECYLSMGIKSRFITCMPKEYIDDCHVINAVYSEQLGKWLWMDPSFNAYISDKTGNLLGIGEVRDYLKRGKEKELVLNDDANWNNQNKQTIEYYLYDYMAKNLYYVECWSHFGYNVETVKRNDSRFMSLRPKEECKENWQVCNDQLFWQSPKK